MFPFASYAGPLFALALGLSFVCTGRDEEGLRSARSECAAPSRQTDSLPIALRVKGAAEEGGVRLSVRIKNIGEQPAIVRRRLDRGHSLDIRNAQGRVIERVAFLVPIVPEDEPCDFVLLYPGEVLKTDWILYVRGRDEEAGRDRRIEEGIYYYPLPESTYWLRIEREVREKGQVKVSEHKYADIEQYFGGTRFLGKVHSNWIRITFREDKLVVGDKGPPTACPSSRPRVCPLLRALIGQ